MRGVGKADPAWPRDRARKDHGERRCSALPPSWLRRVVVEWMLRIGMLNRYIVPLPSEVMLSFPRIVIEEKICGRVRDHLHGMLLRHAAGDGGRHSHRHPSLPLHRLLRAATETWVAALASAPIVLAVSALPGGVRTLDADHRHDRLHRRAAAGDPENPGRARRHAPGAGRRRPQPEARLLADVLRRSCCPRRCRPCSSASASASSSA